MARIGQPSLHQRGSSPAASPSRPPPRRGARPAAPARRRSPAASGRPSRSARRPAGAARSSRLPARWRAPAAARAVRVRRALAGRGRAGDRGRYGELRLRRRRERRALRAGLGAGAAAGPGRGAGCRRLRPRAAPARRRSGARGAGTSAVARRGAARVAGAGAARRCGARAAAARRRRRPPRRVRAATGVSIGSGSSSSVYSRRTAAVAPGLQRHLDDRILDRAQRRDHQPRSGGGALQRDPRGQDFRNPVAGALRRRELEALAGDLLAGGGDDRDHDPQRPAEPRLLGDLAQADRLRRAGHGGEREAPTKAAIAAAARRTAERGRRGEGAVFGNGALIVVFFLRRASGRVRR